MRTADAPLQKITINIYKRDYEFLLRRFSSNYSVELRDAIKKWCDQARDVDYERG